MRFRPRGYCGLPARFILSQRYASTRALLHLVRQLDAGKCLPTAPNSSSMLVWGTFYHTTVGWHALQRGDEIHESMAPSLAFLVLADLTSRFS